jgi:glycosyltransferase involved in cell wall biosynthesis
VIATNRGSVPEIVADGKPGFIVGDVADAVRAVKSLPSISRTACRERVATYFSTEAMATGYEAVYHRLAHKKR